MQYDGRSVAEPWMAKLIIRHMFHNFERNKECVLSHTSSRYIPSTYLALFLLEYVLEAMGKSRINPMVAQALAWASEQL